jgi:hypothetical protein
MARSFWGQLILQLRTEGGLTQRDLSAMAKVARFTLMSIEICRVPAGSTRSRSCSRSSLRARRYQPGRADRQPADSTVGSTLNFRFGWALRLRARA